MAKCKSWAKAAMAVLVAAGWFIEAVAEADTIIKGIDDIGTDTLRDQNGVLYCGFDSNSGRISEAHSLGAVLETDLNGSVAILSQLTFREFLCYDEDAPDHHGNPIWSPTVTLPVTKVLTQRISKRYGDVFPDYDPNHFKLEALRIDYYALTNFGLTTLSVPNGVTEVDLADCHALTSVTLPASVKNLAMKRCVALPSVSVPGGVLSMSFEGCSGLTNVTFAAGLAGVGERAFYDCYRLPKVAFPASVKTLGTAAFAECTSLAEVDFGGVEEIGDKAFVGCTGLKNLSLGEEVRKIGSKAFSGCSGLATVTMPAWVEEVEVGAFSGVQVKTLRFDNANGGLLGMFAKGSLRMLYLGANARGVTAELLDDCLSLAAVLVVPENPEYAVDGAGALYDKNFTRLIKYPAGAAATTYTVPATVRTVDAKAFANATALRELVFQGPLGSIGEDAFEGCVALERVVFPDRVASIGTGAFRSCPSLKVLRFEGTGVAVPAFGDEQFLYAKPTVAIAETEWSLELGWQATLSRLGLAHEWIEDAGSQALELEASNQEVMLAAAGGTGKVLKVKANAAWTAKSSASWLKVKTAGGSGDGKIMYDVAANSGTSTRKGTITVTAGPLTQTFTVTQLGKASASGTLILEERERSFTADAANSQELGVLASSGVSWTAKSSATWLTVKTSGGSGTGTITYDVEANTETETRTGTITVTGGGWTETFTVTQSGKTTADTLTLGANERSFTADAASGKELAVTANVSWTAKSSASWLTVKTASGTGNGKILYNVAANTGTTSRSAKITVSGGGLSRTFTATQSGKGAKSKGAVSKKTVSKATVRAVVTTSDGSDGKAVADGNEGTGWSPAGTAGAWVALTFDEARKVDSVDVIGDRLPAGMRVLASEDGDTWTEEGGDEVQYLWVILPGEGKVPTVREIETEP